MTPQEFLLNGQREIVFFKAFKTDGRNGWSSLYIYSKTSLVAGLGVSHHPRLKSEHISGIRVCISNICIDDP